MLTLIFKTMKPILIITCLFLFACTKENDDDDMVISTGSIYKIETLREITLGQTDTIEVTFSGGFNGCAVADRLETLLIGNTTTIRSFYQYPKKSQICTQILPVHMLKFTYKPTVKGTFTYKSFDTDITASTVVK